MITNTLNQLLFKKQSRLVSSLNNLFSIKKSQEQ